MTMVRCLPVCAAVILLHLCNQASAFNNITKCTQDGVKYNCSGAEFDTLPLDEDLPKGVEVLDLSNNHFYNVTEFNIPERSSVLNILYLSNSKISIIKPMSFSLLTNLVYLDLSRNLIEGKKLEEHMFHDLRKLKTLILERNPLRIIKKGTFNFMQIPALTYLDVSHCDISVLEASSIDLPNLEYLDHSWNHLETLDASSLRMLVSLQTLDMSHNNIRVLDEVPYLPEIATWILDNNGLQKVNLRDEIWNNADSIKKLSLRNNEIIQFDMESFPLDLDTLVEIDLTNNLLQCDCKMTWIKFEVISLDGRNITMPCKYPKELRGRNLLEIPIDELKCSVSLVHILLLVLLIVVVVLCTILMFYFLTRRRCRRKTKRPRTSTDTSGDYTAVYTKDDEDDARVEFSDNKNLLTNEVREFDV